jgi:hypothetical protein
LPEVVFEITLYESKYFGTTKSRWPVNLSTEYSSTPLPTQGPPYTQGLGLNNRCLTPGCLGVSQTPDQSSCAWSVTLVRLG